MLRLIKRHALLNNWRKFGKIFLIFFITIDSLFFQVNLANATDPVPAQKVTSFLDLQKNASSTFQSVSSLLGGVAMVGGLGFALIALLKFKAHKDNPTQIPLSTPFALLAVGIALLFLPTVINMAGQSLMGGPLTNSFSGDWTSAYEKGPTP